MNDPKHSSDSHTGAAIVEETIDFSFRAACRRVLAFEFVFTGLGTALFILFFVAANVAGMLSGKARTFDEFIVNTLYVAIFSMCFFSIPSALVACRFLFAHRVRRVAATPTAIIIDKPRGTVTIPIAQLQWKIVDQLAFDQSGFYLQREPLVVVSTQSSAINAGVEPVIFACGFSAATFDDWKSFLAGSEASQTQPHSAISAILRFGISAVAGATIFGTVGLIIRPIIQIPDAVLGLAFIGLMNGLLFAIGWNILRNWEYNEHMRQLRLFVGPVIMIAFVLFAVMIGFVGGWKFAVGCGLMNLIVGYFAFREFYCRAEIRNLLLEAERGPKQDIAEIQNTTFP